MEKKLLEYLKAHMMQSREHVEKKVAERLREHLNVSHIFLTGSGRVSLFLSLLSLGLDEPQKIAIPDYCCEILPNVVLFMGHEHLFVDINKNLLVDIKDLEKRLEISAKVLIPVHLYGYVTNIAEVMRTSRKYDTLVVEDCAHSLGAEYKGRKAGTFGNIGFYSFPKTIGAYGSAIATNDEEIATNLKKMVSMLPQSSSSLAAKLYRTLNALHVSGRYLEFLNYRKRSLMKEANIKEIFRTFGKSLHTEKYALQGISSSYAFNWHTSIDKLNLIVVKYRLDNIDQMIYKRTKIADLYEEKIKRIPGVHTVKLMEDSKNVFIRFPIIFDEVELRKKMSELLRKNFEISMYYPSLSTIFGVDGCHTSNYISRRILPLPTDISEKQALTITDILRRHTDRYHRYHTRGPRCCLM